MTIARDLGYEVRGRQPPAQRPLPRRRGVPHRHRGRGRADPLGRRPRDRRARARSPARSRRRTSPPSAARSTSTRTGGACRDAADDPSCPRGSRSTTRRCATARSSRASRSPSTTSCASPSSSTGSASTTSRRAGRAPTRRTTSSSAARPTELHARHEHAGRVRLDPPGQGQGRLRRHAAPPRRGRHVGTVCIVGKSWDYHVLEALSTTLDEGVAMVADSVEFLQRARAARCSSTPSTSSTATSATPSSRCACSRARRRRAPPRSCCATPTAARCPHEVERIVARGRRLLRRRRRRRVHLHDDAGTGVANALAGVRGGAIQVQGTINGYGERTGNCNLTTIIPNLTLKMGIETIPRRPARAAHAGRAPRRRAREHGAQPAGAVRRARRRSRTRPGCTSSAIAKRPDAYEHVAARLGRQRHPVRRVGARGQDRRSCSRPRSSASSSTARSSTRSSTR